MKNVIERGVDLKYPNMELILTALEKNINKTMSARIRIISRLLRREQVIKFARGSTPRQDRKRVPGVTPDRH